jgi:hypothetical protein
MSRPLSGWRRDRRARDAARRARPRREPAQAAACREQPNYSRPLFASGPQPHCEFNRENPKPAGQSTTHLVRMAAFSSCGAMPTRIGNGSSPPSAALEGRAGTRAAVQARQNKRASEGRLTIRALASG